LAHDLFGKPLGTFPDHALAGAETARLKTPREPLVNLTRNFSLDLQQDESLRTAFASANPFF
jgi:hypothetical protein